MPRPIPLAGVPPRPDLAPNRIAGHAGSARPIRDTGILPAAIVTVAHIPQT